MPSEQLKEEQGQFSPVAASVFIELQAGTERIGDFLHRALDLMNSQMIPVTTTPWNTPCPPQDLKRAEAQEDKRVAHGATSTWTSENSPSPAFPPPLSCEEDLEGLHMNMDQGPRSPDGQAHNAPHNYEEEETPQDNDHQPQGQLQYEDVSMDEDENDPPEDQRKATALPKEAIGLKESPATYIPKSPKYVRDSEDEGPK